MLIVSAAYGPWFVTIILASMLLFPDGRLPGSSWRLPVMIAVLMVVTSTVAFVLYPGSITHGLPANPIGIRLLPADALAFLFVLDPLGIAILGLMGAASLVARYARATAEVRAQLKWLLASVVPAALIIPVSFFEADQKTTSLADLLSASALLLVPFSIGVAIVRYRLYDIDRLISRGVSWAIVSGLLLAVYAGAVLVLEGVLGRVTQGETIAVATSTLLAAALFQPLRRRIQAAVDRRFNRASYDAHRTAMDFAEGLRDQVDLPSLRGNIADAAERALSPSSISVWLREPVSMRPTMTELTRPLRRLFGRTEPRDAVVQRPVLPVAVEPGGATVAVGIAENDPLLAYLQAAHGPVDVARIELESPALRAMREAGVALVVPLVSQGELIGTLNLGPRLSEQEYSTDDRRLLTTLAGHAAPAIRVAQLVREQAAEVAAHERLEQEMRVATLIQQQFLPRQLPDLPHWQIAAYYGPARAVGGDFYDFIEMPEGRIGIAVGDVTDKGVPAALVMARTHSVLRAEASRSDSPGIILARANELLVPEMPATMFVTCLFAILEPETGRIVLANAGHNLPYIRTDDGVVELRATGMPLGLMPSIVYEETEGVIAPGSNVLLYSDGIVEAHDRESQMFGFPRLRAALTIDDRGTELLDRLLETLHAFTGANWEQEDDITLVTLRRAAAVAELPSLERMAADAGDGADAGSAPTPTHVITAFSVPGEEGKRVASRWKREP